MNQLPDDFGDRLSEAQKMSPEYEHRYRQQVADILNQRLTPTERRLQTVGAVWFFVGALCFLLPAAQSAFGPVLPVRGVLVGLMFLVFSGHFAWTAWRGSYDPRVQPVTAGGLSLVIPIVIAVTLAPGSLKEMRDYVVAISIVLMVLLFVLAAKVIRLDYRIQEKLLELDYRIAELAEKADSEKGS
jgi:hypothetical protein